MSTSFQICERAFKQVNLDQPLISFSNNPDFPYNLGKELLNTVIQEMNRLGRYWFCETSTVLPYSAGVFQYNFTAFNIDPKGIIRLRKETSPNKSELRPVNWRAFQKNYRQATLNTSEPMVWAKYGNTLELNTIPDKDYGITIYYFKDIPLVTSEGDILPIPEADEDVIAEGVYAYLLNRLGRQDAGEAYARFLNKASALLANMKQDSGMPSQMPAAF
jgi:hypothetical protein